MYSICLLCTCKYHTSIDTKMSAEKVLTLPAEEAFNILEAPLIRLVRNKTVNNYSQASLTPYRLVVGGQRHGRVI